MVCGCIRSGDGVMSLAVGGEVYLTGYIDGLRDLFTTLRVERELPLSLSGLVVRQVQMDRTLLSLSIKVFEFEFSLSLSASYFSFLNWDLFIIMMVCETFACRNGDY